MPERDAKLLDIRTSPVAERIAAVDDFVAAGYGVHLNFSPVVLREGWQQDWAELLTRLDDELGDAAKRQAAAEIILLTHNRDLHEVDLGWHPRAEDVLWRPELQHQALAVGHVERALPHQPTRPKACGRCRT